MLPTLFLTMLYVRGQLNSEHERLDHTKKCSPEEMRDILLTKDAEKAFRPIIMLKGFDHPGDELIFPADGYRSYLRRCKDAFAYACECDVADLGEHYVTHTLRATTATVLYNNDVPPKLIQKILGHKSLAMTMRYCHDFTDQEELRDYMQEALDRQKIVV